MPTFNFTTGPATLPDLGTLSYNACLFGPLFESQVSGVFVKDAANRTTKEIEYTITVDGYVTLPDGQSDVGGVLATLERLLSQPAAALIYKGRGVNVLVNTAGGDSDVAWGPLPELIDIVPMGGGRSAKVKWTVKTRIPPRVPKNVVSVSPAAPILQFNFESGVSYDEAGYSTLRLAGITEVPLTRLTSTDRSVRSTADDFRRFFPGLLLQGVDLTRFKPTRREFRLSRDKRTLEFDVELQEHSWMVLPPTITMARGQFSFRPAKQGVGLCNWLCTLTCTYTVPKGVPRRVAWFAFLALLRERMNRGNVFGLTPPANGNQNPGPVAQFLIGYTIPGAVLVGDTINLWRRLFAQQGGINNIAGGAPPAGNQRRVWLIDFNGNEGLYQDARTVTFSATWRLVTVFSEILLASGMWVKVPSHTENLWATTVRNISGWTSWQANVFDPTADAVVDFGF